MSVPVYVKFLYDLIPLNQMLSCFWAWTGTNKIYKNIYVKIDLISINIKKKREAQASLSYFLVNNQFSYLNVSTVAYPYKIAAGRYAGKIHPFISIFIGHFTLTVVLNYINIVK